MSKQIAEIIKRRLKRMGLNNTEFAELMNVHQSTVTKWLSGTHNFTIITLERIQLVLRINFFDLTIAENKIPCFPCIVKQFILA